MFCEKCGKEISNESKFCKFCGVKIVSENTTETDKTESQGSADNQKKVNIGVWDKFAEIYDSKGGERDKFNDLSSNEAWELINRIGKNTFESFIEENKEQLNKQPYTVIESLENLFKFAVIGGYWLWTAEYILENGNSWKLKPIVLDNFIKEWTENLKGLDEFIKKKSSSELGEAIITYQNFKANSFLENCPSIKELPVIFIDNIKSEVLGKILWGYFIGISESKYIK